MYVLKTMISYMIRIPDAMFVYIIFVILYKYILFNAAAAQMDQHTGLCSKHDKSFGSSSTDGSTAAQMDQHTGLCTKAFAAPESGRTSILGRKNFWC
jgi:hypothetical protein